MLETVSELADHNYTREWEPETKPINDVPELQGVEESLADESVLPVEPPKKRKRWAYTERVRSTYMPDVSQDDCKCLICLNLIVKPLTLPCNHELCKSCFDANNDQVSYSCPFCRMRTSNWLRKVIKDNKIVNETRDKLVSEKYPARYKRIAEGGSDDEDDDYNEVIRNLAEPGELWKWYKAWLQKEEEERNQEKVRGEELSRQLIEQLYDEVDMEDVVREAKRLEQVKADEKAAKMIQLFGQTSPLCTDRACRSSTRSKAAQYTE